MSGGGGLNSSKELVVRRSGVKVVDNLQSKRKGNRCEMRLCYEYDDDCMGQCCGVWIESVSVSRVKEVVSQPFPPGRKGEVCVRNSENEVSCSVTSKNHVCAWM